VPDRLWERIAPLLPPPKPRHHRYPGRRPIDDRAALASIVFVLKTGITWNQLPTALVGCSGVTCWRRLRDWTEAGVWPAPHEQLLAELRAAGELDLDRCAVDGSHIRALKGQGPCKVSFARPDLRLWRPASGLLSHRGALHLHGEHSTPAQVRATWRRSVEATAQIRHRIAASPRQHPSRSTVCLTAVFMRVGGWGSRRG
jgi:transposase